MTMHPETRVPPRPWTDEEADRVAAHIHAASVYSELQEEPTETRGQMIVAALAGWAVIVVIVAAVLVVF